MSLIGVIGSAARRRGGEEPAFDVLTLSPALWLDGSDPATMYDATSGGSLVAADGLIARLEDKSGNARHATQADTSRRPVRKTLQFGSLGAVKFDSDSFELPNFLSGSSGEVFFVSKNDFDPPLAFQAGPVIGEFGTGQDSHHPWSDGVIYNEFGTNARKTCGNPVPSLTNLSIFHISSQPGLWFLKINNSTLFTTNTNTVAWGTSPDIGTSKRSATYYWIGLMAEIIFIQSTLTETQRTDTVNYLATKWGVTI
jgi:hypothetical protein